MTRREFISRTGAALAAYPAVAFGQSHGAEPSARVVVARDDALTKGVVSEHRGVLRGLLDAGMQRLAATSDPRTAWRKFFQPTNRIGIKVNTLGLSTQPAVVDAIVAGLRSADVRAENIIIWDRFDVELLNAGFRLNKSTGGSRCFGTDADAIGSGYQREIESSGQIGSCFSRIVAEQVDTLICVPVLKDHNLAGVSLGMKNFFGAIHNPNKYHASNCDPFVADVVSHRFIAPKWRLTVCDGTRAQYHAGPGRHPGFAWHFCGLIVGSDFVATDAVAAALLESKRAEAGLRSLAEEGRPPRHIATAGARGLGIAKMDRIEVIEV